MASASTWYAFVSIEAAEYGIIKNAGGAALDRFVFVGQFVFGKSYYRGNRHEQGH